MLTHTHTQSGRERERETDSLKTPPTLPVDVVHAKPPFIFIDCTPKPKRARVRPLSGRQRCRMVAGPGLGLYSMFGVLLHTAELPPCRCYLNGTTHKRARVLAQSNYLSNVLCALVCAYKYMLGKRNERTCTSGMPHGALWCWLNAIHFGLLKMHPMFCSARLRL